MIFGLCFKITKRGLGGEIGTEGTGRDHNDNGCEGFIVLVSVLLCL